VAFFHLSTIVVAVFIVRIFALVILTAFLALIVFAIFIFF
jgi:hypothetical protein